ncbi:MAG: hypothetical protein IKP40_00475 [Clostridia bacterium]|nr:hypothetical protein [Clostridia bacterium]
MKYPNAAKGINKIYIAEILSIMAAVLAIAMMILVASNSIDTGLSAEAATQALQSARIGTPFVVLGVLMMLLMLVSFFMNLTGIISASKDEAGFKRALWVLLAGIVFEIIASILQNSSPQAANWLKVPATLCNLVVMIFVLEGIATMADGLVRKDISDMCAKCRTYLLCVLILSAAAEVLTSLGVTGSAMQSTTGIAAHLLEIVAYVFYLRVLNKARLMQ